MKRILSLLICATIILSAFSFVMPVYASTEEALIDYIHFDDFSGETISDKYIDNAGNKINTLTNMYTLENGALKFTSPAQAYTFFVHNQDISEKNKKLVVSYKFKSPDKNSHLGTNHNFNATALIKVAGTNILNHQGGTVLTTFTPGAWVTITCVLDNQSTKRDIYVNGQYFGPYDKSSYQTDEFTYYNTNGKFRFSNAQFVPVGSTLELDDYMIYYLPSELKYELESASAKEVKLNFNMIPDKATVIPQNFTVKEGNTTITPAAATISSDNPRQIVLTFGDDLAVGSYTVSAANLTAGSSATDVADTLTLTSNPELAFSIAPAKVEWSATSKVWGYDYENVDTVTGITNDETKYGTFALGSGGLYNIETDGENNFLTIQQNGTAVTESGAIVRFLPRKSNFTAGNAYAFEIKVKVDFSKNPENAMFDTMTHSGWGLRFSSLYNGVVYTDTGLTKGIGTYKDGEWVTLKNVYYSSPVNIEGIDYLRRDIYVNGQFVETVYDSWTEYGETLNGTKNCSITFRVRDVDSKINTEGKAYIDYIRVYKTVDNFAAKLDKAENIDTSYINTKFNSTPVDADLTSKIYIADENGTKVSDISVSEFVNDFNVDGYAAKVNLWFKDELELGKTYKLCINGVSDIAGNKLYQEETFTTKSAPEAEGLTISDGIASVTVNEYSEPLTLYVVGYDVVDGVEQMTTVVTKEITATGTYTTDTKVTEDVVKAFLWKGTKPVIQFVTGGTN